MIKRIFLFFLGITYLSLAQKTVAQTPQAQSYIKQYKDIAIDEMVRTGIPAAISLAQGIVESRAGTSWLALHANNQFGIKCKRTWLGESVRHDDDKKNECFRKYPTAQDSWEDHSNFLKTNKRYDFLFFLDPLDYKAWAYGLQQAGYATHKKYAQRLIATIQRYKLNQYTQFGLTKTEEEKPDKAFAELLDKKIDQDEKRPSESKKVVSTYPQGLMTINKKHALFIPAGTELIGIANQYNVPLRRLLRFNEIDNEVLSKSMLIFVEKKRKRGNHLKHRVQSDDVSYHEIAQEEGIRQKWLLKRNQLTGQTPPQKGDILFLQGYVIEKGEPAHESGIARFFRKLFGGGHKKKETKVESHPAVSSVPSSKKKTSNKESQDIIYHVKSGDTLYGISRKFKVGIKEIQKENNLKNTVIKVGQELKIPVK